MKQYHIPLLCICYFIAVENLQHDFTLTSEYAILNYVNEKYATVEFKFFKLNRTIGAANATFTTKFVVSDNVKAKVKLLQFRSNEYRNTIAELGIAICPVLKGDLIMDTIDLTAILNYSNVTKCPMQPGTYYVNRVIPSADGLPPLIPPGRYKVVVHFMYGEDITIATVEWLAKIDYKLKV